MKKMKTLINFLNTNTIFVLNVILSGALTITGSLVVLSAVFGCII